MDTLKFDFTDELAELLEFTAKVSIAIRRNTPYNSAYNAKNSEHANDVMRLAQCLHNFDMVARAIREANPQSIVFACDMLLSMYERYQAADSAEKAVFDRNRPYMQLDDAIAIFNRIKTKAQCLLPKEGA